MCNLAGSMPRNWGAWEVWSNLVPSEVCGRVQGLGAAGHDGLHTPHSFWVESSSGSQLDTRHLDTNILQGFFDVWQQILDLNILISYLFLSMTGVGWIVPNSCTHILDFLFPWLNSVPDNFMPMLQELDTVVWWKCTKNKTKYFRLRRYDKVLLLYFSLNAVWVLWMLA